MISTGAVSSERCLTQANWISPAAHVDGIAGIGDVVRFLESGEWLTDRARIRIISGWGHKICPLSLS